MNNYVSINNVSFKVCGKVNSLPRISGRNINDCYSRPSVNKTRIFWQWREWSLEAGVDAFGVRGFNCNVFTLEFSYRSPEGVLYYGWITPTYNRVYVVSEATAEAAA